MSTSNPAIRYSYDDYKCLSNATDKRYELLDGDLLTVPSPTTSHQQVAGNHFLYLAQFVRLNELGKVFYGADGRHRCSAISRAARYFFVSRARFGIIAEGEIRGAPDLVVEILLPRTESLDRGYEKGLYARHGAKEYWIVSPQTKSIEVYGISSGRLVLLEEHKLGERLLSPLLPGFTPALDEVFAVQ